MIVQMRQDSGDRRVHHSGQWRQTDSSLRTVETDGFITQDSGDRRVHHSGQWRQSDSSLRTVETDGSITQDSGDRRVHSSKIHCDCIRRM